ncbi:hypothetical protein HU200_044343 [Digitaria exilis]|uniref:Uncharacterized protein n=1 Tax=Digitaria exilis TaxID=1010633 RepID=A0A835B9I4_9POAL|nr:hypothetical protein HU200_044343 [Digitaria exilis]
MDYLREFKSFLPLIGLAAHGCSHRRSTRSSSAVSSNVCTVHFLNCSPISLGCCFELWKSLVAVLSARPDSVSNFRRGRCNLWPGNENGVQAFGYTLFCFLSLITLRMNSPCLISYK